VDQDVYDFLKERAEPFVDTPNSVLRRLLPISERRPVSGPVPIRPEETSEAAQSRKSTARTKKSGRGSKKRGRRSAARAPRGSLLPETEYELPLLRALAERGGSAPSREVVEAVGKSLARQLTDLDKETLNSGVVRWENRVAFVRLRLVEQGLLAKDSPRGYWTLTDAGKERASEVA
jgi:hypothetical protein